MAFGWRQIHRGGEVAAGKKSLKLFGTFSWMPCPPYDGGQTKAYHLCQAQETSPAFIKACVQVCVVLFLTLFLTHCFLGLPLRCEKGEG